MMRFAGVDIGRFAVKLVETDSDGQLLRCERLAHCGDPAGALESLGLQADRALATGAGSGAFARRFSIPETDTLCAAAMGARELAGDASGLLVLGVEDVILASLSRRDRPGGPPRDVRFAQPCAMGVGALLARWAGPGDASEPAAGRLQERVSSVCACAAEADLRALARQGVPRPVLTALAVRAAARILAAGLVQGGPVEMPVVMLGGPARAPGLARALAEELGLGAGAFIAPELAEFGLALGASRLAADWGAPTRIEQTAQGRTRRDPAILEKHTSGDAPPGAEQLARLASDEGAGWAVYLGEEEAFAVSASGDAVYAPMCLRSIGRALVDVARILGLDGPEELGWIAMGCQGDGAYLRDRCPETVRADAGVRAVGGAPRESVARGALEAVARGLRRGLCQRLSPEGDVLLVGEFAGVPGLADALSREFGCRFRPKGSARPAPVAEVFRPSPGAGALLDERERLIRSYTPLRARGAPLGRLGLPRSLGSAEHGPFWASFLAELGFDVATLDGPAPHELSARAASRAAGEPCGAAMALRTELEALAGLGVDAIFLPVEVDTPESVMPPEYRCPFRQSGAYLAAPPVPVLRPIVFYAFSRSLSERNLAESLSRWGIALGAVRRALRVASSVAGRLREELQARGENFLGGLGPDGRAVVLLGRGYSIGALGPELRGALSERGALIPADMLPLGRRRIEGPAAGVLWDCGKMLLLAAEFVARDRRLSAAWLTHVRCGPDSFLLKRARRVLAGSCWTVLELGCESSGGHLLRRAVSFARSGSRVEAHPKARSDPGRRILYFPDMGVASEAAVGALAGFSIPAEVVRQGEHSLRAAARCCSGGECLPYVLAVGGFAELCGRSDFDPGTSAFFMASSSGSCRFSQYVYGLRDALELLGCGEVPVVSLNQSEGHTRQMPGFAFARLLWRGIVALGELDRVAFHLRVRASDREEFDHAFRQSREEVLESLRARRSPIGALARAARRLGGVRLDRGALPVLVAVTGEIFARSSGFANSKLVSAIEDAGGEVYMAPFQEWIYHVNRCVWMFARARGMRLKAMAVRAAMWFLRREESAARRALLEGLGSVPPRQPSIEEVWQAASGAGFIPWFGDASLALGRAVLARRIGARAVVNVVPFGCLPGTVSEAVFAACRDAIGDMPVLHLHVDGEPPEAVRERISSLLAASRIGGCIVRPMG